MLGVYTLSRVIRAWISVPHFAACGQHNAAKIFDARVCPYSPLPI